MQNGIIEKTVKIPFLALKINQLLRLVFNKTGLEYAAYVAKSPST
jgi:hypothetical protein